MSWKDLIGLIVIIVGIVLFLYGSNTYDAVSGWAGVYLILGGLVFEIAFEVYKAIRKRELD